MELNTLKLLIEQLCEEDMGKIYLILKKNKDNYTLNANGVFFNLIYLKKETITQLEDFVKDKPLRLF